MLTFWLPSVCEPATSAPLWGAIGPQAVQSRTPAHGSGGVGGRKRPRPAVEPP